MDPVQDLVNAGQGPRSWYNRAGVERVMGFCTNEEQAGRFASRMTDPMRQWKLSPMDLESLTGWEDYSKTKDENFFHADIAEAPWAVVEAEDKRRARINMISHLLGSVPWQRIERPPLVLPERPPRRGYQRPPRDMFTEVPDHAGDVMRAV